MADLIVITGKLAMAIVALWLTAESVDRSWPV